VDAAEAESAEGDLSPTNLVQLRTAAG